MERCSNGKTLRTLGYLNPVLCLSGIANQVPFKDGHGGILSSEKVAL